MSTHNSETDCLPPTEDLKETSLPRSVPPIVRRANLMLETRPALHTVLGVFAAFLRDSIRRVAISGMTLPGVGLVDDVGGLNVVHKTHTDITLCKVTFDQIHLHYNIWDVNLRRRKTPNLSLHYLVVSAGTRVDGVITHRCENSDEK